MFPVNLRDVLKIVLHEGRCKYLRRLCDAAGIKILNLQRTRVGTVVLDDVEAGSWRVLKKEFNVLKEGEAARPGRRGIVASKR